MTPVLSAVPRLPSVPRRWVKAKAAALGKRHDASQLGQVLQGPMLDKWAELVASMRQQGLVWEYQKCDLRVEAVAAARAPGLLGGAGATGAVDVTVRVMEAARLVQGGEEVQQSSTDCQMVYRLARGQEGWRILACDVVSQD
jgi:hypothetical protein